jgi:pyruvate/2-oxoglutarate dehydrogenase complex dihydrolipoamide acyltransferase (E2) component
MADDAALQAKIAALAGAINRHKQQQPAPEPYYQQPYSAPTPPYRGNHQQFNNNRWAPFPQPRGRGRGGYGASFQNRTLVNATTAATPPATGTRTPQQQQQQDLQNRQEKSKLAQHFSTPGASRELVIEGVRFSMKEDGSKLIRVTGEPRNGHAIFGRGKLLNHTEPSATSPRTPKKAVVAGVEFFRTKNGNLLRSATINVASKYAKSASKRGMNTTNCVTGQRPSQPRNASTSSRTVFHRDHTIQPSPTDWTNLPDRVICW